MRDRVRRAAPLAVPEPLWDEVFEAWSSPGRRYHDLSHLAAMADCFVAVAADPGWRRPREVFVAMLAHDAIYAPGRPDNEARSAVLGRAWAERLGVDGDEVDGDEVERLVLATAAHGAPPDADDPDLLAFLDCDLAVLGAEPEVYDRYEQGVAAEYGAVVPEDAYRAGRAGFLERMIGGGPVFHTQRFRERLEARARVNLERALAALRVDR